MNDCSYLRSTVRSLIPLEALPGMVSLVPGSWAPIEQAFRQPCYIWCRSRVKLYLPNIGKPNPETFPFSKITISLKGCDDDEIVLDGGELSDALQYGLPGGNPELVQVRSILPNNKRTRTWTCTYHPNVEPHSGLWRFSSKSTESCRAQTGHAASGTGAKSSSTRRCRCSRTRVILCCSRGEEDPSLPFPPLEDIVCQFEYCKADCRDRPTYPYVWGRAPEQSSLVRVC